MTPIALKMPLQKPLQQMLEGLIHFDLGATAGTSNICNVEMAMGKTPTVAVEEMIHLLKTHQKQ